MYGFSVIASVTPSTTSKTINKMYYRVKYGCDQTNKDFFAKNVLSHVTNR